MNLENQVLRSICSTIIVMTFYISGLFACLEGNAAGSFLGHFTVDLPNYPCMTQGNASCWTATGATIYNYINGTNLSPNQFVQLYNNFVWDSNYSGMTKTPYVGATVYEVYDFLSYEMSEYEPTLKNRDLVSSLLTRTIDKNYPSYIRGPYAGTTYNITAGHAVALEGYSELRYSDGTTKVVSFRYMEPNSGQILASVYKSYTNDEFNSGKRNYIRLQDISYYFSWDDTIYFDVQ